MKNMKNLEALININGNLFSPHEAKISIFDRGFLFGDSIYEVARSYEGVVFLLDKHLDRLWNSARLLSMPMEISQEELQAQIGKTVKAFGFANVYIRIIVTRGEGDIGLDPSLAETQNFIIIVKKFKENPSEWYEQGVRVTVAQILRNDNRALDPNIKSGNYLNNILATIEAKKKNAFDALMLNSQGIVTESTLSNVWIVQNSVLKTPPIEAGLLNGITRQTILELAKINGLKVEIKNFSQEELLQADECFLTSSTREVIPVVQVDETTIGNNCPGKMTLKILSLYREYIKEYIVGHNSLMK